MAWGESLAKQASDLEQRFEDLGEERDELEAMLVELGNAASRVIWFMMLAELETWDISHGGVLVREQFLSFFDEEIKGLSRALTKVKALEIADDNDWPVHSPS